MRIPKPVIDKLRKMRPTTHEIGGTFDLDDEGTVVGIHSVEGEACRDPNGQLLGKPCTVLHPTGPYVFHTHPRANRPSSTDLKIAIVSDHQCNVIVSPLGIWGYAPLPELRRKYRNMSEEERRCLIKEFRFLGHMQQEATQNGLVIDMIEWMMREGFQVVYEPYSSERDFVF